MGTAPPETIRARAREQHPTKLVNAINAWALDRYSRKRASIHCSPVRLRKPFRARAREGGARETVDAMLTV